MVDENNPKDRVIVFIDLILVLIVDPTHNGYYYPHYAYIPYTGDSL